MKTAPANAPVDLTDRLVAMVARHYEQEFHASPETPITSASRFYDLGMDALDFSQLIDAVEDEFGILVPHDVNLADYSVGKLSALIATLVGGTLVGVEAAISFEYDVGGRKEQTDPVRVRAFWLK